MVDLARRGLLRGRAAALRPAAGAADHAGAATLAALRRPRPPWALNDDDAFTRACNRCGHCESACPRQLLVAGDGGYPEIQMPREGCNFCGDCVNACRTGALGPISTPERAFAERAAIGDACLARKRIECRICGEACGTRAIRFKPALGSVFQPQLDASLCTGCGDCAAGCPTGAIVLRMPVAADLSSAA